MLYVVIGVVVVILVIGVGIYNSLIGKKNQVTNIFGTMDALLKKRYDLIPNLVATVKQYMTHEKDTLTEITALRAKAVSGTASEDEQVDLNNQLTSMLGGIMVAVENYPDLKANENFLQLQRSLNEIEEQISAARRAYNAAVTDYNNACEMFPTNVFANMMGFRLKNVFEISEKERQNVNVKDLFEA